MATAPLKLPRTLEKFVAAQVEQGAYRSRQAAIVAAVASEKRRAEQRAWLNAEMCSAIIGHDLRSLAQHRFQH